MGYHSVPCPKCFARIDCPVDDLVHGRSINCNHCGLSIGTRYNTPRPTFELANGELQSDAEHVSDPTPKTGAG